MLYLVYLVSVLCSSTLAGLLIKHFLDTENTVKAASAVLLYLFFILLLVSFMHRTVSRVCPSPEKEDES